MDTNTNLFRALGDDWMSWADGPPARATMKRWAQVEPALAGLVSPAAIVKRCHVRGDPEAANAVLGAVLRLADEELAARTVLQAVLPSLAARVRRCVRGRGVISVGEQERLADLDQEVVTAALERIRELAGTSPSWPANAIVLETWRRVRRVAIAESRRKASVVSLMAAVDRPAGPPRSKAEEVAALLVEAVASQTVPAQSAAVVYSTRVLGHSFEEVAAIQGRGLWAVRRDRSRTELSLRSRWSDSGTDPVGTLAVAPVASGTPEATANR